MRTKRNDSIGFGKGVLVVIIGLVAWYVLGLCHLGWDSLSPRLQSIVVWIMVISFVIFLIRKCADEANLTVWSWIRQLFR